MRFIVNFSPVFVSKTKAFRIGKNSFAVGWTAGGYQVSIIHRGVRKERREDHSCRGEDQSANVRSSGGWGGESANCRELGEK